MTPPTLPRGKQQDVKLEGEQVNRRPPAARRRSSRFKRLSLPEAPTHLNPSSGGESKISRIEFPETIPESSSPLCKSSKRETVERLDSGIESNWRRSGHSSMTDTANFTTMLTRLAGKKQPLSPLSFIKGGLRDNAHRLMDMDEINKLLFGPQVRLVRLEDSTPLLTRLMDPPKTTNSLGNGSSKDGGSRSVSPTVIKLNVQAVSDREENNSGNDIIVTAQSPILKDGNPLIRLPFSSPRLDRRREAHLISTPTKSREIGIVGISSLPELESEVLDSASSPSRPQPGGLSPISPARNRFKNASFSPTNLIPFGAIPMETSDGAPHLQPQLDESDLSFDAHSQLDGPLSEELEELRDVDSFFAQVAEYNNDIATSSGIMTVTTTDGTLSSMLTTTTVPVMQQVLSSSSSEGQQSIAPANVPKNGSHEGFRVDNSSFQTTQYTLVRLVIPKTKDGEPVGPLRPLSFFSADSKNAENDANKND